MNESPPIYHDDDTARYDQMARYEQSQQPNHLRLAQQAARHAETVGRPNDPAEEMQFAMLHAALATAEAATRQAEVAESMLEFLAEFVGGTNITDALTAWGKEAKCPTP